MAYSNLEEILKSTQEGNILYSRLNDIKIKAIPLLIPSDEAVVAYQNIIGPFFVEILNRLRENHTLSSLRDTLLPKLMSGEIRVPVTEESA